MTQFLVIGLVGVGLFLLGWFQFRKVSASRVWPAVPGRIIAARVEAETTRGSDDEADSTSYYPCIEYQYQVGPQTFRGTRIRFDRRGYARPKGAEQVLAALPIGRTVEVFYDPARPGEAVLERKNSTGMVLMIVGGGIAVLAVAAAVVR